MKELARILLEPNPTFRLKFLRVVSHLLAYNALVEELAKSGKFLKPRLPPIFAIHARP
jgi:hypothetical protein